jgi:glycosyltransferase involved in cell wall biosynthesis
VRIAYLLPAPGVPVYGPSGASAHARGVVRALRESHDVRLLSARLTDRRGTFGEPLAARAVGVAGWPSWLEGYRDLTEVIAARRIARRVIEEAHRGWPPQLVIERHSLFSDAGWRIHDRLGVPWVLEVNAPLWEERRRFEALRRPVWARGWEREVLLAAPVIVAVSQWLVRWLREEVGCKNVSWVPNGAELRLGDRLAGRRRLGASADESLVGFVGSMKPWHGVSRLPRLAAAAGARLVLIGQTPKHPPPNIITTGHLDPEALADVVAALDVGLAPYPADAPPWFCPMKILDYRAQGTPTVATDVGDCRALVGRAGAVVPPDDDDAFVSAVRAWIGRRVLPTPRSWQDVSAEIIGHALPKTPRRR